MAGRVRLLTPARWLVILSCVGSMATGCSSGSPNQHAAPSSSSSSSSSSPAPSSAATESAPAECPWNDDDRRVPTERNENGAIQVTLDVSCLFAGSGSGWSSKQPRVDEDLRVAFYSNGTKVTVSCVERGGEVVTDISGTVSAVWLKVQTTVMSRSTEVYVQHAATGYADTRELPAC